MKNLSLIVTFMSFLLSCSKSQIHIKEIYAHDTINIQRDVIWQKTIPFSKLVERIRYFPIPTDKDFLIGKTSKLMVTDSSFIIMDNRITHSVFAFHKDGYWKSCIHQQGNGPTEYLQLSDICYNPQNNELGVYCNIKNKILYYDLNRGNFLREFKLPYKADMIGVVGDKMVQCAEYLENIALKKDGLYPNLIYLQSDSFINVIGKNYFKGPVNRALVTSSQSWFSSWEDTLSIKPDHCNTVYHCTKDSIFPAHFLDFGVCNVGNRYWSKILEKNMTSKKINDFCKTENLCETIWYMESKDYICFTCKQNGELSRVIYSKKRNKGFRFTLLENDMDLFSSFQPKAILGNKIYVFLSSHNVSTISRSLNEKLIPFKLKDVKEGDNPIIVELTLKDFLIL
ncbi:MAG: 6-bladed beta-propeller [Bacteroidaceae bacterium]|nr:6-bladed beta-propeller [Bacteroidaceae bacterium]